MEQIDEIEKGLKNENIKIFTVIREAYFAPDLHQLKFFNEMSVINDKNIYCDRIKIYIDKILNIDNELDISNKTFYMLTRDERENILLFTWELKQNKDTFEKVFNKTCYSITRRFKLKYKILFEKEISEQKRKVLKNLGVVSFNAYLINKRAIFENLEPFQINRLYKFFNCDLLTKDYLVKAAKAFAEFENAQNVEDFCAAGEYAIIQLRKETEHCMSEEELERAQTEIADDICTNSDKKNEYSMKYLNIKDMLPPQDHDYTFSSKMTAATHYCKHGEDVCNQFDREQSPTNYMELIRECINNRPFQLYLTQDGSHLVHDYTFTTDGTQYRLILYQNLATNSIKVATFYDA